MSFDLDTSTGIAQLLAAVRASELPSAEKNSLRDLVLSYANSHEPSAKITLEQKIATHKLQPIAVAEPISAVSYVFGTTRPAPTTKQPTVPQAQTPSAEQDKSPNVPVTPESDEAMSPANTDAVVNPMTQAPAQESTPSTPTASVPPTSRTPDPVTQPAPNPQSAPRVSAEAPASVGNELARIKEIKAEINALSGNPASLIDATNGIGREYMTALLNAMKSLNSGSATAPAMQQLETAYVAVKEALTNRAIHSTDTDKAASAEPAPKADVPPAPQPAPAAAEPASTSYQATSVPVTPEPKPAGNPVPVNLPTSTPSPKADMPPASAPAAAEPVQNQEPEPAATINPVAVTTAVQESVDVTQETKVRGPDSVEEAISARRLPDPPRPLAHYGTTNLPPKKTPKTLAESESKPHSLDELPDPASIETSSVAGDPLYTKEVDSGLEQLLVEWPIFKKSGLFGTGPKGSQHPLFVKIKDLQIPLLLAGRFEGATQEIKQSITDYMNGWRYEQGIIYEQGETFEHYLRRVIRHILDAQQS